MNDPHQKRGFQIMAHAGTYADLRSAQVKIKTRCNAHRTDVLNKNQELPPKGGGFTDLQKRL